MRLFSAVAAAYVLSAFSGAIAAEPDREMAGCAAIEASVNRLSCFDDLAKKRNVAGPAVTVETKGKWSVVSETSKIDDSTNVSVSLESDNTFTGRFGRQLTASTYIVCRENKTQFYFIFGDHFLSDIQSYGDVTYRIDKKPARSEGMTASTDNSALGLWNGAGVPFIKDLLSAKYLLVQVTPYNESAVTAEFTVAGLERAILPLRKACGW